MSERGHRGRRPGRRGTSEISRLRAQVNTLKLDVRPLNTVRFKQRSAYIHLSRSKH